MSENRLFLSSDIIDGWIASGSVELRLSELRLVSSGLRLALEEAVRVVSEVAAASKDSASPSWVGDVRTLAEVRSRGGELLDRSLVVGDTAYEVVPGFLAAPLATDGRPDRTAEVWQMLSVLDTDRMSDEELLAEYLARRLE